MLHCRIPGLVVGNSAFCEYWSVVLQKKNTHELLLKGKNEMKLKYVEIKLKTAPRWSQS